MYMKKNWNLQIDDVIWVEFWDEIPLSTISLKFIINKNYELLNSEIRLLPLQPRPNTESTYKRIAGEDTSTKMNSQLMTVNTRQINLLKLRRRALNIIFDYQELNPKEFNIKTKNKFNYPFSTKEANGILKTFKHKKNTEDHLSFISLLYVSQIHRGNNSPYRELNKSTGYSIYYLKNLVKKARKDGYLTKPVNKGISGGILTKKCKEKLNSYSSSI